MTRVNLTRLVHANGDHAYSLPGEVSAWTGAGYSNEGVIGQVEDSSGAGLTAVRRAFAASTGEHLFSTDLSEYNGLGAGWSKEGIKFYIPTAPAGDTQPFWRIYLGSNRHLLTNSLVEKYSLILGSGKSLDTNFNGYIYQTASGSAISSITPITYSDSRPSPSKRLPVIDDSKILTHGATNDVNGARDVSVYEEAGTYHLLYDGISTTKWTIQRATSTDLTSWTKQGTMITTSGISCYGVPLKRGTGDYLMYYLSAACQDADTVPMTPYTTSLGTATTISGTWTPGEQIFCPASYYSHTASPGPIIEHGGEYIMFFSCATYVGGVFKRGIGIARSDNLDGPWTPDADPIIGLAEQVENISLYYQASTDQWFLFTNHVGIQSGTGIEYTDSIWVYWSSDPTSWNTANKAMVLDGPRSWSRTIVGLPSVVKVGDQLHVLYDGKDSTSLTDTGGQHKNRDIGKAVIDLPIITI